MKKKLIRLTENDLHKIVKESVENMLVKDSENKVDEPSNKPQIGTPWSENDEVMFHTAKKIIWESDASDGTTYKVIDWLKSLKNRVQSKQNG